MQSWLIVPTHSGGRLQQIEQEQPQPGPSQVLVKIRAASLNHRDLYILEEFSDEDTDTPIVPLSDGAGEIVALGEGSKRFQIGDRVVLTFFPYWLDGPPREDVLLGRGEAGTPGVLADYLVIGEQEVLPLPEHLSYAEGATLPCAGVTAWNALATGQLRAGETVLLQGMGGGSVFGIQFAKVAGARVIVLSRSEEKLARARSLGADETINTTTTPRWDERVLALTDGQGVDHVLDVVRHTAAGLALRVLPGVLFHSGVFLLLARAASAPAGLRTAEMLRQQAGSRGPLAGRRSPGEAAEPAFRPLLRASGGRTESSPDGALLDCFGARRAPTADQRGRLRGRPATGSVSQQGAWVPDNGNRLVGWSEVP